MPRLPRTALVLIEHDNKTPTKHRPTTTNYPTNEENTDERSPWPEPFPSSSKRSAGDCRSRRADSGLTTLEWLLIVAAVAGLAALAVVLVQNVVSTTRQSR